MLLIVLTGHLHQHQHTCSSQGDMGPGDPSFAKTMRGAGPDAQAPHPAVKRDQDRAETLHVLPFLPCWTRATEMLLSFLLRSSSLVHPQVCSLGAKFSTAQGVFPGLTTVHLTPNITCSSLVRAGM